MPKSNLPNSKTSPKKNRGSTGAKRKRSETAVLASRTLSAKSGGKRVRRTVAMTVPIREKGETSYCIVRFGGTLGRSESRVPGKDVFDAVQNALVVMASDFFLLSQHENLNFEWDDSDGTGFPDFPSLRIRKLSPLRPRSGAPMETQSQAESTVQSAQQRQRTLLQIRASRLW